MDEPPKNQRFQFTLRALLLYTFAVAVWISFFTSNSFASMFTVWLLMLLYYLCARNGWCLLIHSSGLILSCIAFAGGMSWHEQLFYVGLKISGIVTFFAFSRRLKSSSPPSRYDEYGILHKTVSIRRNGETLPCGRRSLLRG